MTRIVAGEWRGHPLPKLKTGTVRPTTDRARTILFDTLRDVRNMHVLDLYSGTGALGFEALSRGASSLVSIDKNASYIKAQREWIQTHEKPFQGYVGFVTTVLGRIDRKFDLILADPPYIEVPSPELLESISDHATADALFVYESSKRQSQDLDRQEFQLLKEKVVAETKIQIYKVH